MVEIPFRINWNWKSVKDEMLEFISFFVYLVATADSFCMYNTLDVDSKEKYHIKEARRRHLEEARAFQQNIHTHTHRCRHNRRAMPFKFKCEQNITSHASHKWRWKKKSNLIYLNSPIETHMRNWTRKHTDYFSSSFSSSSCFDLLLLLWIVIRIAVKWRLIIIIIIIQFHFIFAHDFFFSSPAQTINRLRRRRRCAAAAATNSTQHKKRDVRSTSTELNCSNSQKQNFACARLTIFGQFLHN